jgi:hypothetical protein
MTMQPYFDIGIELMDGLGQVARQMAPLDGFKHVVFFGTVVPMRPDGKSELMTVREVFQGAGVYLDTIDLAALRPGYDVLKFIGEANMNELAFDIGNPSRNGRVNMGDPLVASPLLAEGALSNTAVHNGPAEQSLGEISDTTGGQWIHNLNNLGKGLQNLSKSEQIVYTLSFRPHELRQHNTVSVRVHRLPHFAAVRYRQGFSKQQANVADNPLRLADIIVNDTPQSGTPVAIRTIPTPGGAKIQVQVPLRLLASQVSTDTEARVMFYVFNNTGAVAYGQQNIRFGPDSKSDALIRHEFKLSPGHYVAKAVLRLGNSQSVGFTREAFVVEK